MKRQIFVSWIGFCLVLGIASASADVKIGTVDMQKALQTVDAGKKARSELEKEFNKKKAELQKEEASIKKMHDEFQKQRSVLSDQASAKKQAEIQQRIMKFQEETGKSQMEIQSKEQQLTEPIVVKLKEILEGLAKSKGYTVVLEKSGNTVLYSPDTDDLTGELISAYNKKK